MHNRQNWQAILMPATQFIPNLSKY